MAGCVGTYQSSACQTADCLYTSPPPGHREDIFYNFPLVFQGLQWNTLHYSLNVAMSYLLHLVFGVASPVTPPWHMSSCPPGHHTDFVWIENLSLTTNTTALTLSRGDHLLVKCPAQYHLSLSLVLSSDVFGEEARGKCWPCERQRWSRYQVGGKEIWFAGSIESCECDVTGTQIKNILFLLYFDRQTP